MNLMTPCKKHQSTEYNMYFRLYSNPKHLFLCQKDPWYMSHKCSWPEQSRIYLVQCPIFKEIAVSLQTTVPQNDTETCTLGASQLHTDEAASLCCIKGNTVLLCQCICTQCVLHLLLPAQCNLFWCVYFYGTKLLQFQ